MALPTEEIYIKLIHDLRAYIAQESEKTSWVTTDPETYNYFLLKAHQKKAAGKANPEKSVVQPIEKPVIKPSTTSLPPPPSIDKKIEKVSVLPVEVPNQESPKVMPVKPVEKVEVQPAEIPSFKQKQICSEELPKILPTDLKEIFTFFQNKFSSLPLIDVPLDDSRAKATAMQWKRPSSEVLILSFNDIPHDQTFLNNVARAIQERLSATALVVSAIKIEEEKGWNAFLKKSSVRMVIASHNSLHACPELMRYYREDSTGKHTLGQAQLCLLSDLALYTQQPSLKATLWKMLCQSLGNKK